MLGNQTTVGTSTFFGEVAIDEWYFWDNVLTANHVKNLYESYLQGKFS